MDVRCLWRSMKEGGPGQALMMPWADVEEEEEEEEGDQGGEILP